MAPLSFDTFRRDRIDALQRIARATPQHLKPDELLSEAWIAACDLGEKRAFELDLTNPTEQELLLGCLYNRHVKFVRSRRFEESLDRELTNTKGTGAGATWHQRLSAPDDAEPLARLIEFDEQRRDKTGPRCAGFSEFSAYLALLSRFDSSVERLAAHLAISLRALRRRIERARDRANVQATLFDFESMDGNFITRSAWFRRLRMGWHARKAAWGRFVPIPPYVG